jgi:hypothetical protein
MPAPVQRHYRQVRDYLCDQLRDTLRKALNEVMDHGGLGNRDYPFTAVFLIRLDGGPHEAESYRVSLDLRVFDGQPDPDDETGPCIECGQIANLLDGEECTTPDLLWGSLTGKQQRRLAAVWPNPCGQPIHFGCADAFIHRLRTSQPTQESPR